MRESSEKIVVNAPGAARDHSFRINFKNAMVQLAHEYTATYVNFR